MWRATLALWVPPAVRGRGRLVSGLTQGWHTDLWVALHQHMPKDLPKYLLSARHLLGPGENTMTQTQLLPSPSPRLVRHQASNRSL